MHPRLRLISHSGMARALRYLSEPTPSESTIFVPAAELFSLTTSLTFQNTAVLHADLSLGGIDRYPPTLSFFRHAATLHTRPFFGHSRLHISLNELSHLTAAPVTAIFSGADAALSTLPHKRQAVQ